MLEGVLEAEMKGYETVGQINKEIKNSKEKEGVRSTANQPELADVLEHSTQQHTFFSRTRAPFSKTDYMLADSIVSVNFKRLKSYRVFTSHSDTKLEVNNKRKFCK